MIKLILMMIIKLRKEIGSNLVFRRDSQKLFENLGKNNSKVTVDFSDIEFMNRAFAQDYLNRKFNADFEIEEINIPDVVKNMFNVIFEWNGYDMRY